MTKRRKPSSPGHWREWEEAQIKAEERQEKLDYETWREDSRKLAKALGKNPELSVKTEKNGTLVRAVRLDVFDLLLSRSAISTPAHEAVRRLEEQMAFATGALRNEQGFDRVDTTTIGQNITDSMINASRIVDEVLQMCGPVNARLLRALLEPEPNQPGHGGLVTRWRDVTEAITGETNDKAQTASIRQACENLAEAWRMRDYGRAT